MSVVFMYFFIRKDARDVNLWPFSEQGQRLGGLAPKRGPSINENLNHAFSVVQYFIIIFWSKKCSNGKLIKLT